MRGRMVFDIPPRLAVAMTTAGSTGARVVAPSGDIYFGFEQILRDDRLAELLRGCPYARSAPPAMRGTMVDLPETDFLGNDLTKEGFRGISFARCKQICLEYDQCRAVSYVQSKSWCWPKGMVSEPISAPGIMSAVQP